MYFIDFYHVTKNPLGNQKGRQLKIYLGAVAYIAFLIPMFVIFDYKHDVNLLEMRLRSFDYYGEANNWMVLVDDFVRFTFWTYSVYCAIKVIMLYFDKTKFDVTSSDKYKKKFFRY